MAQSRSSLSLSLCGRTSLRYVRIAEVLCGRIKNTQRWFMYIYNHVWILIYKGAFEHLPFLYMFIVFGLKCVIFFFIYIYIYIYIYSYSIIYLFIYICAYIQILIYIDLYFFLWWRVTYIVCDWRAHHLDWRWLKVDSKPFPKPSAKPPRKAFRKEPSATNLPRRSYRRASALRHACVGALVMRPR